MGRDSKTIGSISAKAGAKSHVVVKVPRSWRSPWQLNFNAQEPQTQDFPSNERVVVSISNANTFPLDLYVGRGVAMHSLPSGETLKIYEGSLEGLLLYGHLAEQDLTFFDTERKAIKIGVSIERENGENDVTLELRVGRVHYGM